MNTVDQVLQLLQLRKQAQRTEIPFYRVLVLGIQGTGKQTLLKQLRIIYSDGFSEKERVAFKSSVYNATLESFKVIVALMKRLDAELIFQFCFYSPDVAKISSKLFDSGDSTEHLSLDCSLIEKLHLIQRDRKFQAFLIYNSTQLHEELTLYFINSIERIFDDNYIPTLEDVLNTHYRDSKRSITFNSIGCRFQFVSIDYDDSLTLKHIKRFGKFQTVLICISLMDLNNGEKKNSPRKVQFEQSFRLISKVTNKWFKRAQITVLLTKNDMFSRMVRSYLYVTDEDFREPDAKVRQAIAKADRRWPTNTRARIITINLIDTQQTRLILENILGYMLTDQTERQ